MVSTKKKILITGGTGFIGSHLVRELEKDKDNEIYILTRKEIDRSKTNHLTNLINIDYSNFFKIKNLLKSINPTHILHLASSKIRKKFKDVNREVFFRELHQDLSFICLIQDLPDLERFFYFGTDDMFTDKNYHLFPETIKPRNAYGLHKALVSKFIRSIDNNSNFQTTIIIPSIVYGPNQKLDMLIPSLADSLIRNQKFLIKDPQVYKNYIYISDFINILIELINHEKELEDDQIFLSSRNAIQIKDLCEVFINILGEDVRKLIQFKISEDDIITPFYKYPDCKSIKNWHPEIEIYEGLEKTIISLRN